MKFQAALTNVKFDRDCKNVLRFDSRVAQESYFDCAALFSNAQEINFDIQNFYKTTIKYNVNENDSLNEMMSYNYCIIKDNNENATLKYYYYFVSNIRHLSGNQVECSLEIDIFQTYYIDIDFTDCMISKADLNRFIKIDNNVVAFDGRLNSELFEREDVQNVAKRLKKRTRISLNTYFTNQYYEREETLNKWLDDNVAGWLYGFINPLKTSYKVNNVNTGEQITQFSFNANRIGTQIVPFAAKNETLGTAPINTNFRVICVPVMKSTKSIYLQSNHYSDLKTIKICEFGLEQFMFYNDGGANFYGLKLSAIPPFCRDFYTSLTPACWADYEFNANGDLIIRDRVHATLYGNAGFQFQNGQAIRTTQQENSGIFALNFQQPEIESEMYLHDFNLWIPDSNVFNFEKNEIVGADKNPKYNPKLLNQDYFSLKICDSSGAGYSYDLQKVNLNKFSILISEPLTPDTTRSYARIKQLDGIYSKDTTENFTGHVSSLDMSMSLATDQYQEMLANQKNFHMQNAISGIGKILSSIPGVSSSNTLTRSQGDVSSGNSMSMPGGAGFATKIAGSIASEGLSLINTGLTIDNMQEAPAAIESASGNCLLIAMATNLGVYIEEYEIIENEKEIVNDYMSAYGLTYNKIGKIKNFDNVRKYHNFIKANVEQTTGINISENIHEEFVRLFARGVRLWNNDSFSYEKENYEKWLEN